MNNDNVFARRGYRTVSCATRCENMSAAVEGCNCEMRQVGYADFDGARPKHSFSQSRFGMLVAFIATLTVALPTIGLAADSDQCLAREGKKPIINKKDTAIYERKLFITPDEVARYVFLTNRREIGDRSAAVYRASPKKGSMPGNYWITVTEASDSVIADHTNVRVRRYDAPLPAPTANVLHALWLAVLHQSGTDEEALPSAPTGVLSVVTASGTRLKGVTVSLEDNSLCLPLLNLGESLIEYAKLPAAMRPHAATEIEKQARRLLQRKR